MAAEAARLICGWRSEVKEQWQAAELEINERELAAILESWGQLGLEPVQLLWVALGAEWLLRARRVTRADFEEMLDRIQRAQLRGSDDPDQTALVIECAKTELWRRLRRRRYLVSYRTTTVPWTWGLARSPGDAQGPAGNDHSRTSELIRVRQGPIPNLGPIVAGLLAQGVAERLTGETQHSERLGLALAKLLLNRDVLTLEFRKWRRKLETPIADPLPHLPEPESRRTLHGYVVLRFVWMYASMRDTYGWEQLRNEASGNPAFTLAPVGDLGVASALYAVTWS